MSHSWQSDEQEMADLVDQFCQSEAIPEEVASEVERLYADDKYKQALQCVLEARD